MFKDFVYRFSMLLVISFIGFTSIQCEEEALSEALVYSDDHVRWANAALEAWDIGLQTNTIAYSRNPTDNWIVVADDECNGEGIPDRLKEYCAFDADNPPIGFANLTLVDKNSGSDISAFIPTDPTDPNTSFDTSAFNAADFVPNITIVIRQSYIEAPRKLGDVDVKDIAVSAMYVHEIGHALGLAHTNVWGGDSNSSNDLLDGTVHHIMFHINSRGWSANDDHIPCSDEIAAIKAVYGGSKPIPPKDNEKITSSACNFNSSSLERTVSSYFIQPGHIFSTDQEDLPDDFQAAGEVPVEVKAEVETRYSTGLYHDISEKPVFKIYPYLP